AASAGEKVDFNQGDQLDVDPEDGNDVIALKAALLALRSGLSGRPADAALINVGAVAMLNPPPRARPEPRPAPDARVGAVTLQQPNPALGGSGVRRTFKDLKTEQEKRE